MDSRKTIEARRGLRTEWLARIRLGRLLRLARHIRSVSVGLDRLVDDLPKLLEVLLPRRVHDLVGTEIGGHAVDLVLQRPLMENTSE
jgi:hypothetical protein